MIRLPLRAYALTRRKPSIDVGRGKVTFVVPSWFGDHTFSVRAADVVVADASDASLALPYLDTRGEGTPANLALAFRDPVPVPPADPEREPLPLARPGYLDGLRVLAADPRAAAAALASAGAERVDDLGAWFAEHRPHLSDPAARPVAPHPGERWLRGAGGLLLVAAAVAAGVAKARDDVPLVLSIVSVAVCGVSAFLMGPAPRLLRRRGAARPRPRGDAPAG